MFINASLHMQVNKINMSKNTLNNMKFLHLSSKYEKYQVRFNEARL